MNRASFTAIVGTILLLMPMGLATAQEEDPEYPRPRDLSDQDDDPINDIIPGLSATSTKCDAATTICATSIAIASVVCTAPAYRTRQCTSAHTVGGQGTSPVKLAGRVDWYGDGASWGGCSSFASTTGSATWTGGLSGPNGNGSQTTLSGCTKVKFFAWGFGGCVTVAADAWASATAKAQVSGVTVSQASSSIYHDTSNQACVTDWGS